MLTVLMATYNGAMTLPYVLKKYTQLEPPAGGWKVIIVDNGSADQTKEIIATFSRRLPLTYLYEPKQGKNVALNKALPSVSGDLVVFTDDDTLPRANWLRLLRSAADSNPSFAIFGGPILPKWEASPEEWMLTWVPLGPTFALLNPLDEGPIHPRLVFGPNMALRTSVFEHGYRFDEGIGPNGSNYAMGSETELLRRLARDGFQAWHCRKAIVYHIIRLFQMSEEWILGRAVRYGRGQYRMQAENLAKQPLSLLGIPLPLLAQIAARALRILQAKCHRDAERIFKERWQLKYLIGNAIEAQLLSEEVGFPIVPQGLHGAT